MAFGTNVEGFSISHAQILDGSQTFLEAVATAALAGLDVYGVKESSLAPDLGSFDNEGDNQIMSTWNWFNKADLTVQSGYVSFGLIAKLTGQTISSSTTAGKTTMGLDLWHEDDMNVAAKPVLLRIPSKDDQGQPADFVVGLYKVNFKPIQFDGPTYRDGLKVNYDGTAIMSSVDEKGVAFADGKKRVGRLLAIQR
jgi:hypothetical protein